MFVSRLAQSVLQLIQDIRLTLDMLPTPTTNSGFYGVQFYSTIERREPFPRRLSMQTQLLVP